MTSEEKLLAAAEARLRTAGYNGFSFRDIARDTGMTSAGVHHHFPTKADLVTRLTHVYTQRFLAALDEYTPENRVEGLRRLFADSLKNDGRMCLCGLLAAESGGLPEEVAQGTRSFFESLSERLIESFPDSADPRSEALTVLATLEGAMLVARTLSQPGLFDTATRALHHPG